MTKELINIINPGGIDVFLREVAEEDKQIYSWLKISIRKSILKRPESVEEARDIPYDAPDWIKNRQDICGGKIHLFNPDLVLFDQVRHIVEWLKSARKAQASFLSDLDDKGRSKKLVALNLETAAQNADKWFERRSRNIKVVQSSAKGDVVMAFNDGYSIVQITKEKDLRPEGQALGHCLGKDVYDHAGDLNNGTYAYYSLRDSNNKPHVTLSVDLEDYQLLQSKGKKNEPPIQKYMPYIQTFIKENKFELAYNAMSTGLLKQEGEYYDAFNLPDTFKYDDSLFYTETSRSFSLPKEKLSVGGDFRIILCPNIKSLPKKLRVEKNMYIGSCSGITSLPSEELYVGGNLMVGSLDLPKSMRVKGTIRFNNKEYKSVAELRKAAEAPQVIKSKTSHTP